MVRKWAVGLAAASVVVSSMAAAAPTTTASATESTPAAVTPPTSSPPAPSTSKLPAPSPGNPQSPHVEALPQFDTATSDAWKDADGAMGVQFYAEPKNYKPTGSSTYQPIVTTLEADPTHPGQWRSTANSWTATFGPSGAATGTVQVTSGTAPIGFTPLGAASVSPAVTGSTATYDGLWPHVNGSYGVTTTGVREDLTLTSPTAPTSFSFQLTTGVTAETGSTTGGLQLVAAGRTVASIPPVTVTTAKAATVAAATSGATQTVGTGPSGRAGGEITIALSPTWLASLPKTAFPVTVDPTLYKLTTPKATRGGTRESLSVNGATQKDRTAIEVGDGTGWRAILRFDFTTYDHTNPPWVVEAATLRLHPLSGSDATTTPLYVYADQNYWNSYTTFTDGQLLASRTTTDSPTTIDIGVGAGIQRIFDTPNNSNIGLVGAGEQVTTLKIYGTRTAANTQFANIKLTITLAKAPPQSSVTTPSNGSTIPSATPTLTASHVTTPTEGVFKVGYEFSISTDPDGTGQVISSGWVNRCNRTSTPSCPSKTKGTATWTVPPGSLTTGATYYARVVTSLTDGNDPRSAPSSPSEFKVTLHLGSGGPSPTDTVGAAPGATSTPAAGAPGPATSSASVTVNMVTGDLSFDQTTHSLTSLAGPVGLTLDYNSLQATAHGLTGLYYEGNGFTTTPVGKRLDPDIDYRWTTGKPIGGITASPYSIRWTGSITVPLTTGDRWQFGVLTNGTMKVTVGGTNVATDASGNHDDSATSTTPYFGGTQTLSSGSHPITVTATTGGGDGTFELWARRVSTKPQATWPQYHVPSTWLAPSAATLPAGWSLSAANLANGWVGLDDLGASVVLKSADGSTAAFTFATGHYQPPPGDTGLYLAQNGKGQLELSTPTDVLYTFNASGTVASIESVADDRHPAALRYSYTPTTFALKSIEDPVSTRTVTLFYRHTAHDETSTCPTTTKAPLGMLCKIHFWDDTTSLFTYNTQGELVQTTNPGGTASNPANSIASFGYTKGRLNAILDPLAGAAIAAGKEATCPATGTKAKCETQITYGPPGTQTAKVTSVTQPAPTPGAARPKRTYTYAPAATGKAGTTEVSIAGFTPPSGYDERVTYNTKQQITDQTTAAGLTTESFWNKVTQLVATIKPNGEETSSVYNLDGEVTDSYGPAPVACFTASTSTHLGPVATPPRKEGCGVSVPRTQTGYDQTMHGLAGTYWANATYAGAPAAHGTISTLHDQFPTKSATGTKIKSIQLTGTLHMSGYTLWGFKVVNGDTVTVIVDGKRVVHRIPTTFWNNRYSQTGGSVDFPSPGTYTIQVDANGPFDLEYEGNGSNWMQIPATTFNPQYGLKTSTTTPDGDVTKYSYTDPSNDIGPQYGLVTATTENSTGPTGPTNLNLTTSTTYEPPSKTTYLRKTSTVLPDGGTTTYEYYTGTSGPISNTCGVSSTTRQGGELKEQITPTPGTSGKARAQQFVYDAAGSQVGVRVGDVNDITSASWHCTTYDLQGRITSQSSPAYDGASARTVHYSYGVGGNPLVNSVTATTTSGTKVTSTVDLESRVVIYISDGKITSTTYNQAGQVTTTTEPGGQVHDAYNDVGQLSGVSVDGTDVASSADYCSTGTCAGQLAGVTYLYALNATYGFDQYGRENQVAYYKTTKRTLFAGDQDHMSLGGRVLEDLPVPSADSTFTNPRLNGGEDFFYDGAGRLTEAYITGANIDYSYGASTPGMTCPQPTAGKNTDLASVTYHLTGGKTTSTTYCYNGADQVTKVWTWKTGTLSKGSTSFTFDTVGSQTQNKSQSYSWTSTGRLASVTTGTKDIHYTYDALGRVIERTDGSTTVRYAYCGYGTSPCAVLNGSKDVVTESVELPGNVLYTTAPDSGRGNYSLPNLHGNYVITMGYDGQVGGRATYTPYGQVFSKASIPGNLTGGLKENAFGANGKLTETTLTTALAFLGTRVYSPDEGRFLSVDPIEGGCANAYVYVKGDPVNSSDMSGQAGCQKSGTISKHCGVTVDTLSAGCTVTIGPAEAAQLVAGLTGEILKVGTTLIGAEIGVAAGLATGDAVLAAAAGLISAVASTLTVGVVLGWLNTAADHDDIARLSASVDIIGLTTVTLSEIPTHPCGDTSG